VTVNESWLVKPQSTAKKSYDELPSNCKQNTEKKRPFIITGELVAI
jgi:hypothetical protein